MQINHVEVKS